MMTPDHQPTAAVHTAPSRCGRRGFNAASVTITCDFGECEEDPTKQSKKMNKKKGKKDKKKEEDSRSSSSLRFKNPLNRDSARDSRDSAKRAESAS